MKQCSKCKIDKEVSDFYTCKGHSQDLMSYCKDCFNKNCIQRWINRKIKAIDYKGNKCEKCGLQLSDSHYSVFEFHHVNPSEKDYDWTKLRLRSWNSIVDELNKCQLLCANCHRITHATLEK